MPIKEKLSMDLDKLTEALENLDPETYPEYTSDWPKEELKAAIKEGDESGDSGISSLEGYRKAFASNTR